MTNDTELNIALFAASLKTFIISVCLATLALFFGVNYGLRLWLSAIPAVGIWQAAIIAAATITFADAVVSNARLEADNLFSRRRAAEIIDRELKSKL